MESDGGMLRGALSIAVGAASSDAASRAEKRKTFKAVRALYSQSSRDCFGTGASSVAADEDWRWLPLDDLPLAYEDVEEYTMARSPAGRDSLWIHTKRGQRAQLVDLRACAATLERLQVLLRGHRDVKHTLHVLNLLAERTARTADSAQLVAARWAEHGRRLVTEPSERPQERAVSSRPERSAEIKARAASKLQASARARSERDRERRHRPFSSALADAVDAGNVRQFSQLLQSVHADSFSQGSQMSALHLACERQSAFFIRQLLRAGAHTDLTTHDGWSQTALHIAAANARLPIGSANAARGWRQPTIVRADGKVAADVAGRLTHAA